MKFSIIGTGFIFPAHVEAIRTLGGKIRDVINTARGENAWKEMIKTTDANCVVILAPNDLHFEMATMALDAGKTVLSEKPLAINSQHIRELAKKPNIFTALQLRYHPIVKMLEKKLDPNSRHIIEMDISVYRDEKYYAGWKGQIKRSGGVLINLGIHYFDMLIHLFGAPTEAALEYLDEKTGRGRVAGKNYACNFTVSTGEKRNNQRRVFKIDGENYNFSSQDNLSYENLHRHVYYDLIHGNGATPQEALASMELIEKLYKSYDR